MIVKHMLYGGEEIYQIAVSKHEDLTHTHTHTHCPNRDLLFGGVTTEQMRVLWCIMDSTHKTDYKKRNQTLENCRGSQTLRKKHLNVHKNQLTVHYWQKQNKHMENYSDSSVSLFRHIHLTSNTKLIVLFIHSVHTQAVFVRMLPVTGLLFSLKPSPRGQNAFQFSLKMTRL